MIGSIDLVIRWKGWTPVQIRRNRSRHLRDEKSASATFPGLFFFVVGATGTGSAAASTAFRATGSGLIATSGAITGSAAAHGKGGSCNQTGNTKPGQNLFQVVCIHDCLL
jgi:hypothetical protein